MISTPTPPFPPNVERQHLPLAERLTRPGNPHTMRIGDWPVSIASEDSGDPSFGPLARFSAPFGTASPLP